MALGAQSNSGKAAFSTAAPPAVNQSNHQSSATLEVLASFSHWIFTLPCKASPFYMQLVDEDTKPW